MIIIFEKLVFSKEKNRLETAHWAAAQAQYNTLWIIFRYFSVIWETTQILLSGMFMMTFITDFLQRLLCFPNFYISHSQWGVFVHNFHYLRSSFMILRGCCHSPLSPHTRTGQSLSTVTVKPGHYHPILCLEWRDLLEHSIERGMGGLVFN